MKVIVAGSRTIKHSHQNVQKVIHALKSLAGDLRKINEIVSGGAHGADILGERIANDYKIKVTRFYPDWDRLGKSAGPIRNEQMARYADALVLIWDGNSRGSKSMLREARKYDLDIEEIVVK